MKKFCPTLTAFKRDNLGFTLVELMVVISIMGILFGLGMARYVEFNRRQLLFEAGRELKSNLQLIRNKASAGEKDCGAGVCGGVTNGCGNDSSERALDGWYVNFSAGSYQLYGVCGGVSFGSKTVGLTGKGISVTTLPSPNPIVFKVLNQGTNINSATSIVLSGPGGSTQTIVVDNGGEIR